MATGVKSLSLACRRLLKALPSDCSWMDRSKIEVNDYGLFHLHMLGYVEIQIPFDLEPGQPTESIAITPLGLKAIGKKKSRSPKAPAKSPMHSP
jgi:hypothetical protein